MPRTIDACFVFDDHEAHLELRRRDVEAALQTLVDQGELSWAGEVRTATSRADLLWELQGLDPREAQTVLVVSGLFADAALQSGAIGARLLRAIAQHPIWGPRTLRVVLTRHAVEPVLDQLHRFVH